MQGRHQIENAPQFFVNDKSVRFCSCDHAVNSFSVSAGEKWFNGALNSQQDANQADSTHIQQDQQVHVWLPEHCGCLWDWDLPGDQPRSPFLSA